MKEYIVIWHYVANYGASKVRASSAEEAAKFCLYYDSPEVEVIAFPADTYYLKKGTKGSRLSTGSGNGNA